MRKVFFYHNEAAIRGKQTASSHKSLRQQYGENIFMTNYILRCGNVLYSKPWLCFNLVRKEQYSILPQTPDGLLYTTQISGTFRFSVFLYSQHNQQMMPTSDGKLQMYCLFQDCGALNTNWPFGLVLRLISLKPECKKNKKTNLFSPLTSNEIHRCIMFLNCLTERK